MSEFDAGQRGRLGQPDVAVRNGVHQDDVLLVPILGVATRIDGIEPGLAFPQQRHDVIQQGLTANRSISKCSSELLL